jgi:hypothetical protein
MHVIDITVPQLSGHERLQRLGVKLAYSADNSAVLDHEKAQKAFVLTPPTKLHSQSSLPIQAGFFHTKSSRVSSLSELNIQLQVPPFFGV